MSTPLRPSGVHQLAGSKRVLVVDDDDDTGELIELLLQSAGHQPHLVDSALAALAVATVFCPHVALIDIGLPDMDGYELCRLLRARPELAGCHFIAVTGYSSPQAVAQSLAAGFERHLTKPVDYDVLLAAVTDYGQPQSAAR